MNVFSLQFHRLEFRFNRIVVIKAHTHTQSTRQCRNRPFHRRTSNKKNVIQQANNHQATVTNKYNEFDSKFEKLISNSRPSAVDSHSVSEHSTIEIKLLRFHVYYHLVFFVLLCKSINLQRLRKKKKNQEE